MLGRWWPGTGSPLPDDSLRCVLCMAGSTQVILGG
jgi:hypothetical protein